MQPTMLSTPPRTPPLPERRCAHRRHAQKQQQRWAALSPSQPGSALQQPPPPVLLRPIQPQPLALNADGLALPNRAVLTAVPPALQPLLGEAVAAYGACCSEGNVLVGVYLRGSLPQPGCFLEGVSDADFVGLYVRNSGDVPPLPPSSGDGGDASDALRLAARQLQRRYPQCTKVELKSEVLLPGSPLYPHALRHLTSSSSSSSQPHAPPGRAPALPASVLPAHAGLAFQLKSAAICLHGWDLPALLPDVAALPQPLLLPSLVDDVAAAAAHARLAGGDDGAAAAQQASCSRAARWALKRCIRAAYELTLCDYSSSGGGSGSGSTTASSAASPLFTRDLYWCLRIAGAAHPRLAPLLEQAAQAYLQLAGPPSRSASQDKQGLVASALLLADRLAQQIDLLFLQAMLTEEPGWLPQHTCSSSAASAPRTVQPLRWHERLRVGAWAAGAAWLPAGADLEGDLADCEPPPPPVAAAVGGSVLTLDWGDAAARRQAVALIDAAEEAGGSVGGSWEDCGSDGGGGGEWGDASGAAVLPLQPVLLRGAAAHWGALRRWSLGYLARAGLQGSVRLAPSLHFPYCEPRLADILRRRAGVTALPSAAAPMSAAEFAARLQRGNPCGLRPRAYPGGVDGGGERCYMQADVPPGLLDADLDLASPPFAFDPVPQPEGDVDGRRPRRQRLRRPSQAARLWVSPRGAISPTHYDGSHSFLVQVKGRKRMLFWSPDQAPMLYCYPDTHLLRRRSRINLEDASSAASRARFPLFGRATATEALLEPGDAVFFPAGWAHWTASLNLSMSVTCRF